MNRNRAALRAASAELELDTNLAVLCAVEFVKENAHASTPEFARLRPTHVEKDGKWVPIADPTSLCPDNGLVFWWRPPADIRQKHMMRRVLLCDQPLYDGARNKDRYQVSEDGDEVAEECLSISEIGEEDDLYLLFDGGVPLARAPIGRVYFLLTDGRLTGPFDLMEEEGKWKCSRIELRHRVPVRTFNKEAFCSIRFGGTVDHLVAIPQFEPTLPIGFLNAQSPKELLGGLLRRVRALDRETAEALNVTYAVYEAHSEALSRADLPSDQKLAEITKSGRLKRLLGKIDSDISAIEEIASTLALRPQFQDQIRAAVESEKERRANLATAEIDAATHEKNEELKLLQGQLAQSRRELDKVNQECAEKLRSFDAEVSQHLETRIREPIKTITDHMLFKALNGFGKTKDIPTTKVRTLFDKSSPSVVSDDENIRKSLISAARKYSISDFGVLVAASSCIAGCMPLVHGPNAHFIGACLAESLGGGRLFSMPVSPATFGVLDLLGRFGPDQVFSPSEDKLLYALREAQAVNGLVVIQLEGVNRAPVESYLPPLLASLSSAHLDRPYSFAVPGDSKVCGLADDGSLHWPKNVLLVGTLLEGPSTFKIPRDLLTYVSILPSWLGPQIGGAPSGLPVTAIPFQWWLNACQDCALQLENAEHFKGLSDSLALSMRSLSSSARSLEIFVDKELAALLSLITRMIPILCKDSREASQILRANNPLLSQDWVTRSLNISGDFVHEG